MGLTTRVVRLEETAKEQQVDVAKILTEGRKGVSRAHDQTREELVHIAATGGPLGRAIAAGRLRVGFFKAGKGESDGR